MSKKSISTYFYVYKEGIIFIFIFKSYTVFATYRVCVQYILN